jgi:O-antigen/teichoic acid export membrane protein
MSERKLFLKGASWLFIANLVVLATGFIARPLIARLLGPTEYAVFALVLATGAALANYLFLSLNTGITYHVAREPKHAGDFVSTALAFLCGFSFLLLAPTYLFLRWAVPALGFEAFVASFALAFALSMFILFQSLQQGLGKFQGFGVANASLTLLAAALSLASASLFTDGAFAGLLRALAILVVSVAGLLYYKRFGRVTRNAFNKLWSYSRPLALAGLGSALIAVVDKYFIAAFAQLESVAPYDISLVLVTALLPFGVSLANVMMPSIARDSKKALSYYPRIAAANAAFLTLAGLTLYYYADVVINLLVGEAYLAEGVGILRVLALALPVMGFKNLNNLSFQGLGEPKRAAFYALSLVIVNVLLNSWLVPTQGALGAATATLLTYLIVLSASTLDLRSRVGVGVKQSVLQLILFAGFAAAYWLFDEPGFVLKTLCLAAFAFATMAIQRKLVGELIETVKGFAFFGGNKK